MTGTSMTDGQAAAAYFARRRNRLAQGVVASDDRASKAYGLISFSSNPSTNDTITLGGTVVTFGSDVALGADLSETMANLISFLNASADGNISKCVYRNDNPAVFVQSKTPGIATFTLAASAATVSGSTLKLMKVSARAPL